MIRKITIAFKMLVKDLGLMMPATYLIVATYASLACHFAFLHVCRFAFSYKPGWVESLLFGICYAVIISLSISLSVKNQVLRFSLPQAVWAGCGGILTIVLIFFFEIIR